MRTAVLLRVLTLAQWAICFGLLCLVPSPGFAVETAPYLWWEGESTSACTLPKVDAFPPAALGENAKLLSGGDWLNSKGIATAEPLTASWKVSVPADGTYAFWVRKFWRHGPFRWRFDSMPAGQTRECSRDAGLVDDTQIKPLVSVSWVSLGSVELKAGERTLDIRLIADPGSEFYVGIDCFVLSKVPFLPNGQLRPGEKTGKADDGFFPFEPDIDPFREDAALDLRSLNEKSAGESGFLRRDGKQILLGDGKPVRFWSVNVKPGTIQQDRASIDYMARKLAKLGVNMVRFHGGLSDPKDPSKLNAVALDQVFYLVWALKKQGIYTALSFYFPIWVDGQKLGLEGFEANKNKVTFSLLYFDPKLQGLHRGWMKELLTTPSPYSGMTLARDPAVGLVEIINEDSLFFWTFNKTNLPPIHWTRIEDLYNQWLVRKYGQVKGAFILWGHEGAKGDTGDRAALYELFHLTSAGLKQGGPGKIKRVGDQVQFMAELQKTYYDQTIAYLRSDLHVGGLITTSNWTTADPATLGAAERWTYTGGDVLDTHGYFEPEHKGEGTPFFVRAGNTVKERAAVQSAAALPIRLQQVEGFPQFISEIGFTQPNRYRADGTFLASAYGALQGIDGICFFAMGSNFLIDGGMQKFQLCTPAGAYTFPAAAMVYRAGLVKEAEPAVFQVAPATDLWAMKPTGGWSATALDGFRQKDVPPGAAVVGQIDKIDGLSPYVGPVVRSYGGDVGRSYQRDLPKFIDRQNKSISSLTGELRWDYGQGVATMNAPGAQGAAGFLKQAGTIATSNLKITLDNEFGTLTVVAMDGQPIQSSRKILVQVMTQDQPAGYRLEDGVIKSLGTGPFGVRKIAGNIQISLGEGRQAKVVAVDANGYPMTRELKADSGKTGLTITLLPDVLYYLITR